MSRDLDSEQPGEYVRALAEHIDTQWAPQRIPDEKHVAMYWNEHGINAPDTKKKGRNRTWDPVRMSTGEAAREIELIQSFYGQAATLGVHWLGEGSRAADKDEFGLNEMIDTLNPSYDSPRQTRNWQMVTLGRGISFIVAGKDYYWDFPQRPPGTDETEWAKILREWRRMAPIPVIWKALPAQSTFPAYFSSIDDEVLSTQTMTWHELADIFSEDEYSPVAPDKDDKKAWHEKITLGIYSNRKQLQYFAMEEHKGWGIGKFRVGAGKSEHQLRSIEHGLERSAIRIHPGKVSGIKEPGKYWLSAIHFSADHIQDADEQMSYAATAAKGAALPPLKAWLHKQTNGDGSQGVRDVLGQMDMAILNPGDPAGNVAKEDIQGVFQPNLTKDPLGLGQWALGRAERESGTSSALEGDLDFTGPAWSANFAAEKAVAKAALLTENVVHADVEDGEQIMRALRAFGEPFTIPVGEDKERTITVEPKKLEGWEAVLKGKYAPRVMMNKRAEEQLAIAGMIQVAENNLPFPPPDFFAERLSIEQPLEAFKRTLKWKFLQSDEMTAALMKQIQEEAQVEIAQDEGMSIEELQGVFPRLPPEAQAAIMERLRGNGAGPPGAGAGAGGGGPTGLGAGDANSLMKAAVPFGRAAGGPDPTKAL